MFEKLNLRLFDAGASTGAAASGDGGAATGGTGEATQRTGDAGRHGTGKRAATTANVIYGKQASDAPTSAEEQTTDDGTATGEPKKDRRSEYKKLIGDYKDFYEEDVQRIIDKRFRSAKETETKLHDAMRLVELAAEKYGLSADDPKALAEAFAKDRAQWQAAADAAGMDVDQFQKLRAAEREIGKMHEAAREREANERAKARADAWAAEAKAMKADYPQFDLIAELRNDRFAAALRAGVPVRMAYEGAHFGELRDNAVRTAVSNAEKSVVDNIRARGARPTENGTMAGSPFVAKTDVTKLTKKDRAEIARRVARGEKIVF